MHPKPLTSAQIRAARALIRWSAEDLARATALSVANYLSGRARPRQNRYDSSKLLGSPGRFEHSSAGVEFIDEDGGGPGVRLRRLSKGKNRN